MASVEGELLAGRTACVVVGCDRLSLLMLMVKDLDFFSECFWLRYE